MSLVNLASLRSQRPLVSLTPGASYTNAPLHSVRWAVPLARQAPTRLNFQKWLDGAGYRSCPRRSDHKDPYPDKMFGRVLCASTDNVNLSVADQRRQSVRSVIANCGYLLSLNTPLPWAPHPFREDPRADPPWCTALSLLSLDRPRRAPPESIISTLPIERHDDVYRRHSDKLR